MTAENERGGALVNDDLEVGYDEGFERRWIVVQAIGLLLMVGFVLLCASGLLGRGPLSHAEAASPDGSITVRYERVVREETATVISLLVSNRGELPRHVSMFLPGAMLEPMGLQREQPRPDASVAGANGVLLEFTVAPRQAETAIRIAAMPGRFGPVRLQAWLGDAPPDALDADPPDPAHVVRWTQWVLP